MASLRRYYFFVFIFSAICLAFFIPVLVLAGSPTLEGLNATAQEGYQGAQSTIGSDFPTVVGKMIGIVLSMIGVIFFVLMIYGGLMWMTARGNDQQVEKAKSLMGAAVVGLIIILSAYAITTFIGKELIG